MTGSEPPVHYDIPGHGGLQSTDEAVTDCRLPLQTMIFQFPS
jgi:hypothetical protein